MELFIWVTQWYLTTSLSPSSLFTTRRIKDSSLQLLRGVPYTYQVWKRNPSLKKLYRSTNPAKVSSAEMSLMDLESTNPGWSNNSALSECVILGKTLNLFNSQFQ